MGTNAALYESADHEDYIEMELTSSPKNREFEFQMSSTYNHNQETTADELFHNGKLLPLRLLHPSTTTTAAAAPPCEIITKNPSQEDHHYNYYSMPLESNSCNNIISPSAESSRMSCELNPSKPRPKKLKLIRKLKSSRAYLKSLFNKPHVCSDDRVEYENCGQGSGNSSNCDISQRRSFSGVIKRHSPIKCLSSSESSDSSSRISSSSSSFSFRSNGTTHEFDYLRRGSSFTEIEVSINAAIAHCKSSLEEDLKRRDFYSI